MEIKPNQKKRFNQSIWGLLLGLLLPTILFMCVFLYYYLTTNNPNFNFNFFIHGKFIIAVITVCVLPNLLLYVIFKKLDYWYAIKGLVTSILIFVIISIILKFL